MAILRPCGGCVLCCKVMHVPSIDKPEGQWCPHCKRTGGPTSGCSIYLDRPRECAEFNCLWRLGFFRDKDRPDKVKCVFSVNEPKEGKEQMMVCYESHPGASRGKQARQVIEACLKKGVAVYVMSPDGKRSMSLPPGRAVSDFADLPKELCDGGD